MRCATHCPGHGGPPVALAVSVCVAGVAVAGVVWVLESVMVALLITMGVVIAGSSIALVYVLRREMQVATWRPAKVAKGRRALPARVPLAIEAPKPDLTVVPLARLEARR